MTRILAFDRFDAGTEDAATVFVPRGRYATDLERAHADGKAEGAQMARAESEARAAEAALEISRCLQHAAFTHFEARRAILNALRPVLERMVDIVLPALANQALADIVVAQVEALATEAAGEAVLVACAPDLLAIVSEVLAAQRALPVPVSAVADAALGPLEVRIRGSAGEIALDVSAAMTSIAEGVAAFYALQREERAHG